MNNKLKGMRYISMVRCSLPAQADTSTDDQLAINRRFGTKMGMLDVGVVRLDGLSASNSVNIDRVIDQIIERNRLDDDFDALMVQDLSRLTRDGSDHTGSIRYRLAQIGVRVIDASNYVEDPVAEAIISAVRASTAREDVRNGAFDIARGLASAVQNRRKAYCARPPFGVDRLYVSPDGEPLYRIRNLANGTQVKLDPVNEKVLARYGRNPKKGAPVHHIKQQLEWPVLIPGAREAVETVHQIYRMKFVVDWGAARIAKKLNELGRPSPTNRLWSPGSALRIVNNPIYSGIAVAMRRSSSRFYRMGKEGPEPVELGPNDRTASGNPVSLIRPADRWLRWEEDRLAKYLPEAVQQAACRHHERILADQASGYKPKPRRDAARESDFLLSGLLCAEPGGYAMTGTIGGREGQYRSYRVKPAARRGDDRPVLRRRLPADQIEREVLGRVRAAVLSDPSLEQTVRKMIEARHRDRRRKQDQRGELLEQRDRLRREIDMLVSRLDELGAEVVKAGLLQRRPRLDEVEASLADCDAVAPMSKEQIRDAARRLVEPIRSQAELFESIPPAQLRVLIRSLVGELSVDLETCEISMTLRLPQWAVTRKEAMGLLGPLAYQSAKRTHHGGLVIADLRQPWPDGPCCRRRGRAA